MLPAHLAENIRKQVLFYLQSTFDFRDPAVEKAFERFLTDPDTGLFKGPWCSFAGHLARRLPAKPCRLISRSRFIPSSTRTVPGGA